MRLLLQIDSPCCLQPYEKYGTLGKSCTASYCFRERLLAPRACPSRLYSTDSVLGLVIRGGDIRELPRPQASPLSGMPGSYHVSMPAASEPMMNCSCCLQVRPIRR